ncbi:MAG: amidohydrolase family protein [Deltaproteobacteria bacterium]|nr:amidohydrolase family protein [Deltaproteobacteria bacterium]
MKNIDSHVHLWDTKRLRYPWLASGAFPALPNTYLLPDAIADAGMTEAAFVVIQSEVDHAADPVEETAWMQETVDNHPQGNRLAGFVAYADLSRPDVERVLERHARHPVFRGIRQEMWWQRPSPRPDILEHDLLANSDWRRGFGRLHRVNAVFDLTCWPWQLAPFAAFLGHHPHVPVIIDHLGSPVAGDPAAFGTWLKGMRELAALPNTFMKVSGLSQADAHWSVDSLRPFVREVLDAFGPERCMLGSNFPPEKLSSTYGAVWSAFEALFAELSHEEREKVFHKTAEQVYRLAN